MRYSQCSRLFSRVMSQQQLQYVCSILLKPLIIICTFHRSNKKAFDSVDPLSRFILFEKLSQNYQINSPSWFHDYLSELRQQSPRVPGVPQGSILGPLLLSLPPKNCNVHFNAKDTILYAGALFQNLLMIHCKILRTHINLI